MKLGHEVQVFRNKTMSGFSDRHDKMSLTTSSVNFPFFSSILRTMRWTTVPNLLLKQ